MTTEEKNILEQIEDDIRRQKDFEISTFDDAKRRTYLVEELKKAIKLSGLSLTEVQIKQLLHKLDSRLFEGVK